jgi:hypothetical protein
MDWVTTGAAGTRVLEEGGTTYPDSSATLWEVGARLWMVTGFDLCVGIGAEGGLMGWLEVGSGEVSSGFIWGKACRQT